MHTLKEIRKILNINEQDPEEDSWSDEDLEGDGKPFTPFELAILKLIHNHLTTAEMEDILTDHAYPGKIGAKWNNIAKLVGLNYEVHKSSMEDVAVDKRYVKWALDNWTEDGDYGSITKPIKVPPKRYHINRDETGSQVEYKSGSANVIAYDEDNAADTAEAEFWDWGGEMDTDDYGDWESFESEITSTNFEGLVNEEKQKQFKNLIKLYKLGEKYTPKIVGDVTKETLVDFLKENINKMVYREEPKDKHLKKMNGPLGALEGFPLEKFKNISPPENESTQTEKEIDYLHNIPVKKELVDSADDISSHFEKFLHTKGLEFPKEELKKVMKGVKTIILQLKYHYNRPRPFQVAKAKNLKLDSEHLKSASTPSYPSGHATQGTFIARYLADLYPEYEQELIQIGEDIAFSRNMAKVHYPTDSQFGKILGNELYQFVYQPEIEMGEEVKPNTQLDGNQSQFIKTLEKLKEQYEPSSENGDDKLLVPAKTLEEYGDKYLKENLKKELTGILECIEKQCYRIGDDLYYYSKVDEDGERVKLQYTCSDCTEGLNEILQDLDRELIKMGFLQSGESGYLQKPFPKGYNRWVESVIQEINPEFYIDDRDEVSYRELGNPHDAYYDLSEQISPEALQDLDAFHGEELELDERKLGEKIKNFTNKKKERFKTFWSKLTQGAKRERKETAEAIRILGRLINNKDSVTKEDLTFLKQQSGDIARIIALLGLGTVSVIIPVGLEKLLNQYGISIMPRQRGKDEDTNGIDDYIDSTQDDNLLKEHKELNPPLKKGDEILVIDTYKGTRLVSNGRPQSLEPQIYKPYRVFAIGQNARVHGEHPEDDTTFFALEPTDITDEDRLNDYISGGGKRRGQSHLIAKDTWILNDKTINQSSNRKREINPELEVGDVIRMVDLDNREGDGPEIFSLYKVITSKFNKLNRSNYGNIVAEVISLENQKTHPHHYDVFSEPYIRYIYPGDSWVHAEPPEVLQEHTDPKLNPSLNMGDVIRVVDVDKESIYEWRLTPDGREQWFFKTRAETHGEDTFPKTMETYYVISTHPNKLNKDEEVFGDEYEMTKPHFYWNLLPIIGGEIVFDKGTKILTSNDKWIMVNKHTSNIPGEIAARQKEIDDSGRNITSRRLNESVKGKKELSPPLEIGDLIRVIEVDGEHANMPTTFKVYEVVETGGRVRGPDRFIWGGSYTILPLSPTAEDEVKYLYHGDVWIKESWPPKLNESPTEQKDISPILKHGDIVTVIDVPEPTIELGDVKPRKERQSYAFGEPQLFKPYWVWHPSYGTPKVEGTYIIVPLDEVSELQKLGYLKPEDEGLPGHLHRKLKTLQRNRGDKWLKTNPTEPLNEQKDQSQLNPELESGDTILIVDIDRDRENGTTMYSTPPEDVRPERYIPYTVVDKESNGHKSKWRWRYVVVPEDKVEGYKESKERGYGIWIREGKLLYPWIYQWIKRDKNIMSEQQFPFNPQNKDMERDHPEGEPDWSIRRGKQHYAMNVENTPTESRTAFNNYLVKNSPFIIEGFDFYLSAVPGNMPGEAIVDVYIPVMDDSVIADEIWNTERTYITREFKLFPTSLFGSNDDIDNYEFTEHTDMLHNIGYDQKFGEYYYYEDFQEKFPDHIEQISTQLEDTNLLNAPGKQYEHIWRSKRNTLKREMEDLSKLFGLDRIVINRDPQRPWKRQVDSYGNEEIRPGKAVPREWPRS